MDDALGWWESVSWTLHSHSIPPPPPPSHRPTRHACGARSATLSNLSAIRTSRGCRWCLRLPFGVPPCITVRGRYHLGSSSRHSLDVRNSQRIMGLSQYSKSRDGCGRWRYERSSSCILSWDVSIAPCGRRSTSARVISPFLLPGPAARLG